MHRVAAHADDGGFQRPLAHRVSDSMLPRDGNPPDRAQRADANAYARFREYSTERRAKRAWGEKLEEFLRSRGGLTWNPVVAGRELDLYVLYHEVCRQGGVEAVVNNKGWKKVTAALGLPPSCTNAAYTLRRNYYRWLYAFECQDVLGIHLNEDEVSRLAAGIEPPSKNDKDETKKSGSSSSGGHGAADSKKGDKTVAPSLPSPPDAAQEDSDAGRHWWARKRKPECFQELSDESDGTQRKEDVETRQREMEEDWEHASNLVQAARTKAKLQRNMPGLSMGDSGGSEEPISPNVVSIMLNDLTKQVLALGGPNVISQGWTCSLVPASGQDASNKRVSVHPCFISPDGEQFRTSQEVVLYLQRERQLPQDTAFDDLELSGLGVRQGATRQQSDTGDVEMITVDEDEAVEGEENEGCTPRGMESLPTEQQQRAALFGVPRTTEEEEDIMISMLCHTVLPLVLDDGRLIIKRLGEIVHQHPSYHGCKHIFPVGFRAVRTKRGLRGTIEKYDCEILHCGRHPLFRITPVEDPSRRAASRTPAGALQAIFDGLPKGDEFRSNITGEQFFGLEGYERVRHLIEALPGANLCSSYTCWARGRPPASPPPPPFRITRPMAANPLAECLSIVQDLGKHPCAWPFLEPTKPAMDPDYSSRVPRPMDLSTVLAKAKDGAYQNPHQVRVDVNQIWRNCLAYNGADDDAVLMAREVSDAFEMFYADRVFAPAQAQCKGGSRSGTGLVGEPVYLYDACDFVWQEGRVVEFDKETLLHRIQLERAALDAALSQDETSSDEAESFLSIAHAPDRPLKSEQRLPDLVPASAMVKVDRREQARQQRHNAAKRAKAAARDAPQDLRWVRIAASDIALKEVISKDTAAWPGKIDHN